MKQFFASPVKFASTHWYGWITSLAIYNKSSFLSVLAYRSESWKITEEFERKLDSFENKCLRQIVSIKWNERYTKCMRMRCKSVVHVSKKEETRLMRQALMWEEAKEKKDIQEKH